MKVKNVSSLIQEISGIPSFIPGEIKEVSKEDGEMILKNSNFIKVEKTEKQITNTK